jgi:hypothetical protein
MAVSNLAAATALLAGSSFTLPGVAGLGIGTVLAAGFGAGRRAASVLGLAPANTFRLAA